MSGCCVMSAGAAPGRLEPQPERSQSPGDERAPAATAADAHRSVTLETPASPRGPVRRAPPGPASPARALEERARPSRRRARTQPWAPAKAHPCAPSPVPCSLAAANHRPARRSAAVIYPPCPALSGFGIRRCGGQVGWRGR